MLVGFMGAGKSTIGRRLAKRLGFAFVDLDRRIEVRAGRKIAAIFQEQGEAAFRELELEESRAVASLTRVVVATGGGAFAQDATRDALQRGASHRLAAVQPRGRASPSPARRQPPPCREP